MAVGLHSSLLLLFTCYLWIVQSQYTGYVAIGNCINDDCNNCTAPMCGKVSAYLIPCGQPGYWPLNLEMGGWLVITNGNCSFDGDQVTVCFNNGNTCLDTFTGCNTEQIFIDTNGCKFTWLIPNIYP